MGGSTKILLHFYSKISSAFYPIDKTDPARVGGNLCTLKGQRGTAIHKSQSQFKQSNKERMREQKKCDISPQNITKVQATPEITTLLLTGCKGKATFWKIMREGVYFYPAATGTEKWYFTQSLIPEEAHGGKNRIIVK